MTALRNPAEGGARRVPRAGLAALGVLALLGLPAPAAAVGIAVPAEEAMAAFCTGLEGIVARERAREASDFAGTLTETPDTVHSERRMESDAVLTPDEAVMVAERLWALWVPTAPAGSVDVVKNGPDTWELGPVPSPDPPFPGEPIRIDKRTGKVTWRLPHPSERERLQIEVCGPGEPAPP